MTEVYWLEQTENDLPATNDWLSVAEAARLERLCFERRHRSWRLGRWTAKLAVAVYRRLAVNSETLRDIEVLPASGGAPEVFFAGQPGPVTISLSHRDGTAVCAVALSGVALGCDLEIIEPRSQAFAEDYFTAEEHELVARARADRRARFLTLLWSGKESTLKALREGLRLDTRSVVVNLDPARVNEERWPFANSDPRAAPPWLPFHTRCVSGQVFHGWWQITENLVRTLVAAPPPQVPIVLSVPLHSAQSLR
jgi:4'-phosphopantetheinyl transferase